MVSESSNEKVGPWIETASGVQFHFLNPSYDEIRIADIAHSLALNCRFVGQCRKFYSVAEHSWHVARMLEGCPYEIQLAGLLHDASEAYITDVASPVKEHVVGYSAIEDGIMKAIAQKYGFEYPLHPAVKQADKAMLSNEAYELMPSMGQGWNLWGDKRPKKSPTYRPIGMSPEHAEEVFLDKFKELFTEVRRYKQTTG